LGDIDDNALMCYERRLENESVFVYINFSNEKTSIESVLPEGDFNVLLTKGAKFNGESVMLAPNGYIIVKSVN